MSSQLPSGWTAHQNPEGRWYFAHTQSGRTQWHHPSAPPPPAPPAPLQHHAASYPMYQPTVQHHQSAPTSTIANGPQMSAAAARFVLQQPTEFKLKEKAFSLSGDDFKIKRLDTGQNYFKVKGNALSFKDSKTLVDMNGNPIYKMSEALMSLRGRMSIIDVATKQTVVTLRTKSFIPGFGTRTILAWAGSSDQGDPFLQIKGDFLRKDFSVKEYSTARTVATIKRKSFNLSNLLLEKDSYIIRVEPGVDTALLIFFVIAADEQYRDDGERQGLL